MFCFFHGYGPLLDLHSFPTRRSSDLIAAIREGGIKIVETAGRSPEQYMPALKAAGIKVIHKCTSVRQSLKAERSEEHTSELQSLRHLVCRLLLEKKK